MSIKEESKHFISEIFLFFQFFIKKKTLLFYCCHIFDRMGLYIGHMRKCCRLSALLTIIDYSPDTQQRPLSLSLFLFHTISLCVSVYWWGRRQWLSVLWWLGEQQAYGEVRQGTARPLCLLWPTRYTPLKENQSHHTTDTYPPPFLLSSLCSSPLFYPHTHKPFIRCCYWTALY